ncbi:MAG: hypothetical protein M3R38_29485 [Actinomycetota bacterium]|nr:hypothetical protein [Actinomycetota bacterium]
MEEREDSERTNEGAAGEQDPLALLHSRQAEIEEQVYRIRSDGVCARIKHRGLGIITIASSAVLGGSLGASLVTGGQWISKDVWLLIGAALGVLSAMASGLQTQNRYAEQAQAKFLLSVEYVALLRDVQRYLSLNSQQYEPLDPLPQFLGWVDERLSELQRKEASGP